MGKEEFLRRLESLLDDIPPEERADALAFYRSYFEDAGEGNEAKIIRELESPEKVAESIKKNIDAPEPQTKKEQEKKNTALIVGLAVLASPFWLAALIVLLALFVAALAVVLALFGTLVGVTAALFASGGALAAVAFGQLFAGWHALGLGILGVALLLFALGVLAVVAVTWCFGKFLPWAVTGMISLCKKPFAKRKGEKAA